MISSNNAMMSVELGRDLDILFNLRWLSFLDILFLFFSYNNADSVANCLAGKPYGNIGLTGFLRHCNEVQVFSRYWIHLPCGNLINKEIQIEFPVRSSFHNRY